MTELVSSIGIGDLVEKLRAGEYLVPRFQREFVWSAADITSLLNSIIESRPIGMMTLWEQPDDSGLDLEHISLPDDDAENGRASYFGNNSERTKKSYAILDGRQRSTAIAIAFGGLRGATKKRQDGRFFLNVASHDPAERIVFKRVNEIESAHLDKLANCISHGLFPFEFAASDNETVVDRWVKYQRDIIDDRFYKDGIRPERDELDRRIDILDKAVRGVRSTELALYVVPKRFSLAEICEIFETLNTTGTKVSTVDLIHSWLYSDTQSDTNPVRLREWIKELGQTPGAIGWSDPVERPELIAQFVTATYLAEKNRSPARKIGGRVVDVRSVKSGDLLATPTSHWKDVISKTDEFASYIQDFQECVSFGRRFPMDACPYPISAAIYVALRWTNKVDTRGWKLDAINTLYRAFFWRNALNVRYDQGFLTKMSSDLKALEDLLDAFPSQGFGSWAQLASDTLSGLDNPVKDKATLVGHLLGSKPAGALGKALVLPVLTTPQRDLLEPTCSIESGKSPEPVEVHHLFPRAWVRNNIQTVALNDWKNNGAGTVECVANLTPMLRSSNSAWRAKAPGKALTDADVTPTTHAAVLSSHWLDGQLFEALVDQADGLPRFWQLRADAIAEQLVQRMTVQA